MRVMWQVGAALAAAAVAAALWVLLFEATPADARPAPRCPAGYFAMSHLARDGSQLWLECSRYPALRG